MVDSKTPIKYSDSEYFNRDVKRHLRLKYPTKIFKTPSFEAVSYTHLRAHETVLDLVCRLLLEKKKKKIKYQIINLYTISIQNKQYLHQCSTTPVVQLTGVI
ncbi:hypothetical protein PVA38_11620 [Streptococcus pneumoniae D39]|nr:hypothetical protein PVA38_11620 [Streptococcus pneumoniae D39]